MAYSDSFKARVRESYLSDEFPTVAELAAHFGVSSATTINRWVTAGNWDEAREKTRALRSQRQEVADLSDTERHVNQFRGLWNSVAAPIAKVLIAIHRGERKPTVPEMNLIARVLTKVQYGQEQLLRLTAMPDEHAPKMAMPPGTPNFAEMSQAEITREIERLTTQIENEAERSATAELEARIAAPPSDD